MFTILLFLDLKSQIQYTTNIQYNMPNIKMKYVPQPTSENENIIYNKHKRLGMLYKL